MTTLISDCPSVCPSVFEAGLPVFGYDHLTDPDEALRVIADTRRLTPIAIGPYGPEVLSYDLVRTVLRWCRRRSHPAPPSDCAPLPGKSSPNC